MYKTHVMLDDAPRLQKRRQQFGAEQVEVAQQYSIPLLTVEPDPDQAGIGIINGLALLRILQVPNATFITAFELHSPVHRFPARPGAAAGSQMGRIAAQHLDAMAAFPQTPDEIGDGAAVAAQLLGGIEVGDNQ